MIPRSILTAALLVAAVPAMAQTSEVRPISGTRLDVVATGEVTRVPDLVLIHAGVVTQASTAVEAMRLNAARMEAVRAALRAAGIADRDIQTSTLNLNPNYRYVENQPPQLIGYQATNQVQVRFRDIAKTGPILDALVAQGANQINGPTLTIERPQVALDEARTQALTNARARAELYARALGMRVARVLVVSEAMGPIPLPRPEFARGMVANQDAATQIDPGEQTLNVSLTVSFELE